MKKTAVLDAILSRLDSELAVLMRGARASFAAATDPDSKAENKYDTRTLEASYVARGQAQRVAELQQAVVSFESQRTASGGESVGLGSLVTLDVAGHLDHYFIGPAAGGLEVTVEGCDIMVITAASPLGAGLLGKEPGAVITLPSGHQAVLRTCV